MEGYETPPVAGPSSIGQLAEVAIGTWADIVDIIAPASALAGDLVSVEVKVKNLADYPIHISVTGRYDGVDVYFSPDYAVVAAGQTYSFTYSFTMPNNDIRFRTWSWYWVPMVWYQDDYSFVDIALAEVAPPETYHLGIYVPVWAYGGYVEPGSGDYPAYSIVTLTAYPLSGYQFVAWGGDASGTDPTYNLYMDSDKHVEAYFEKVPVPESEFRSFAVSEYTK